MSTFFNTAETPVLPMSRITLWLSVIRQRCYTRAFDAPELFIPTKSSLRRCRAKAMHLAPQLRSPGEYKTEVSTQHAAENTARHRERGTDCEGQMEILKYKSSNSEMEIN